MATKSITITNEAYERLANFKDEKESFSDVINKITKRYSLLDLIGILSNKEAEDLKEHIKVARKRLRRQVEQTALKLK